jgi:hypothetical protein
MFGSRWRRRCLWGTAFAVFCTAALVLPARAQHQSPQQVNFIVEVKDSETGEPINQAHLTLKFREPGSLRRLEPSQLISYSAKTNAKGRYKFMNIPKGKILLMVTADRHKADGKEYDLEQDGQVIEVKLKKPQPLL